MCPATVGRPAPRLGDGNRLFSLPQRHDALVTTDTEHWEMRADRVGDVARRQVRIVLFGHPRVGMAKLFGDDAHRNAAHGERRAMSMPKHME